MTMEMTPLCGYGMRTGGAVPRTMKTVTPTEGASVKMPDEGRDGMLLLTPAAPLQMITLELPASGGELQLDGICSMQDIASIVFFGGIVLNPPMELLANQAIQLQRIQSSNNSWVTI